jgi:hypothetical protein
MKENDTSLVKEDPFPNIFVFLEVLVESILA